MAYMDFSVKNSTIDACYKQIKKYEADGGRIDETAGYGAANTEGAGKWVSGATKDGMYLIDYNSLSKTGTNYRAALTDAYTNYKSFGTNNNAVWLGTVTNSFGTTSGAWISPDITGSGGNSAKFVLASAFNLDTSNTGVIEGLIVKKTS